MWLSFYESIELASLEDVDIVLIVALSTAATVHSFRLDDDKHQFTLAMSKCEQEDMLSIPIGLHNVRFKRRIEVLNSAIHRQVAPTSKQYSCVLRDLLLDSYVSCLT